MDQIIELSDKIDNIADINEKIKLLKTLNEMIESEKTNLNSIIDNDLNINTKIKIPLKYKKMTIFDFYNCIFFLIHETIFVHFCCLFIPQRWILCRG